MECNELKVESGKWKVSKSHMALFTIILLSICGFLYVKFDSHEFYSSNTYHYNDNIYIRIMNIKTNAHNNNEFDIAIADNNEFTDCSLIDRQKYQNKYFNIKRNQEELNNSCVKINVFGVSGDNLRQIKKALQKDATELIIFEE